MDLLDKVGAGRLADLGSVLDKICDSGLDGRMSERTARKHHPFHTHIGFDDDFITKVDDGKCTEGVLRRYVNA